MTRTIACSAFRTCWGCFLLLAATCASAGGPAPAERFQLPDALEASVWAPAGMLHNPTNIDVDERGRVWVAEAVNYRDFNSRGSPRLRRQEGDRIVVLEDSDGNGQADRSTVFVEDPDLVAPLGLAVFGNRVVVSCSPSLLVYTDRDRNGRFDRSVDTKEVLLSGFGGLDHDHGLHAVVAGPDGRWYFTVGNAGSHTVTDRSGWTLRAGGWYTGGSPHNSENIVGRTSDDGRIYVGGLAMAIDPDGRRLSVFAHNFRNNYEACLDSFGNVFQNDNDDEVASCRTTWLMEHGNAGYSSADGRRRWQADRRPGQTTAVAHWHQDDPGVIPSGDVYGGGAPTGMLVYEADALGESFRGLLLSCDAGRNVVFGYRVVPRGAGFDLRRFSFFSSGLPDDPQYKWSDVPDDPRRWFRPADVAAGPEGAVYVADWFDPIVGGHAMHDREAAGAIYRISPRGRSLTIPDLDLETVDGQIAALASPAVNVRYLGFERLRAQGDSVLPRVIPLVDTANPFVRARAVWLMAQLGPAGREAAERRLNDGEATMRVVAFRALRAAGGDAVALARRMAADPSPAVRREVALAMRDVPFDACSDILRDVADRYDGSDRWYLEAFGTACDGKEEMVYRLLQETYGRSPTEWDARFAGLVWRLHPAEAIEPLTIRAQAESLDPAERRVAIDTLAFIRDPRAADAVQQIASREESTLSTDAAWWVAFRRNNLWREFVAEENTVSGAEATSIATLESIVTVGSEAVVDGSGGGNGPAVGSDGLPRPTMEEVLKLGGEPVRGHDLFTGRAGCAKCHLFDGRGSTVGPDLTDIGRRLDRTRLLEAILSPSASIGFGYETWLIELEDGRVLSGFVVGEGDPLLLLDAEGKQHAISTGKIAARQRQAVSIMPDAGKAGLAPQDLADLVSFLVEGPPVRKDAARQ